MSILRTNTTSLSENQNYEVEPNMMYYNENGFDMISLDLVKEDQEMFDMFMQRSFAEAAVNANIDNTILEASMPIINKETLKNIWTTIIEKLGKFAEKFEAAYKFVKDKLIAKINYYGMVAKKYEKIAVTRNGGTARYISKNNANLDFSGIHTFTDYDKIKRMSEDSLNVFKDSCTENSVINSIVNNRKDINTSNTKNALFTLAFTVRGGASVNSSDTKEMVNMLKNAKSIFTDLDKKKSQIMKEINSMRKDANSALKGLKGSEDGLEIEKAKAYSSAISVCKKAVISVYKDYTVQLVKGYSMAAASLKAIAEGRNNNEALPQNEAFGEPQTTQVIDPVISPEDQQPKDQTPVIDPTKNIDSGAAEEVEVGGNASGQVKANSGPEGMSDDAEKEEEDNKLFEQMTQNELLEFARYMLDDEE